MLGSPIGHSLSPVIHNAGYAAAGLGGWRYDAHDCGAGSLAGFVAGLGAEWAGLSVTMPLKQEALRVASTVAPVAAATGAANTLVRRADGWHADNTDVGGIVDAVRAAVTSPLNAGIGSVAILGAGGTARAAIAAARDLGVSDITVYARRPEALIALDEVAQRLGVRIMGRGWAAVDKAVTGSAVTGSVATGAVAAGSAASAGGVVSTHVIISTVPAGVADSLATALDWSGRPVLFDALYHPWPTPLAVSAAAAGCAVIGGLDLLLAQAVRQFVLFTGVAAPVEAMRAALVDAARAQA